MSPHPSSARSNLPIGLRLGLGPTLQIHAPELAREWRRCTPPRGPGRLLDGAVESFIFELGRAVDEARAALSGPWTRICGVLRLPLGSAEEELEEEFAQLRRVLCAVAQGVGTPAEVSRLVSMLEVAKAIALLHQQIDSPDPTGPRFGGVVVQVFEAVKRSKGRLKRAA